MKRIKELIDEYEKTLEIYEKKASALKHNEVTPGFQISKAPSVFPDVHQPEKHSKKRPRK